MTTLFDTMVRYLESEPRARERRSKDRGIVNMLIRQFPALEEIPKETIVEIVQEYNSLDRYWRKAMLEHPHLRGADYDTKAVVEQRAMQSIGYEVRHHQDVRKLETL